MAKRTTRRASQSRKTEPDVSQDASAASAPAAVMEHLADEFREPGPDEIARRAYELYCERGCEPGREMDDWLQAERELRHHG